MCNQSKELEQAYEEIDVEKQILPSFLDSLV